MASTKKARTLVGSMVCCWAAACVTSVSSEPRDLTHSKEPLLLGRAVVTLTFDDGLADQYQVGAMLEARGMRGTFYANSGRIGAPGFMSHGQLLALQAAGHEIGGHTVGHVDLPALAVDEQRRQVCNDRHALLERGFAVTSFAYPYGAASPAIEAIVSACGYNSARGVGGLVTDSVPNGRPYAETYPPFNAFDLKTPGSIKTDTPLVAMQELVTQAEDNGGGWVPLVFHHVCNGCATNAITAAQLGAFLDWLAARAASGTVVQTVHGVMEGDVEPGVLLPPAAPASQGPNLLTNPSLEIDNNNDRIADCWQRGGFGDNTFAWDERSDAHGGTKAQAVQISRWTTGARRLISQQDLGSCSPQARPGQSFVVQGHYKSDGPTRFTAYYRNAQGGWIWWAQSGLLANGSEYAAATWTVPSLPAGANAISVGLSLYAVGTLVMDDFSMFDADTTSPSVSLVGPLDSSTVSGTVHIVANASDAGGIERVELLVNGQVLGTRSTPPYALEWNSATYEGSHVAISARAYDRAGNVTLAESQLVAVSNPPPFDTEPPTVTLLAPLDGQRFALLVEAELSASDNTAVQHVELLADGALVASAFDAPYVIAWDAEAMAEGPTTLLARAFDLSGNHALSSPVTIAIDRGVRVTCDGSPCAAGPYNRPVAVQFAPSAADASSIDSIRYTVDGSSPTSPQALVYGVPFAVSQTTNVRFVAFDAEGALGTPAEQIVRIDTAAPTGVSIATPANGATVNGTVPIVALGSDDQGIFRVRFYLDGVQLGTRTKTPWRWNWSTAGVPAGVHRLQVQVDDAAGNATRSPIITVTVAP